MIRCYALIMISLLIASSLSAQGIRQVNLNHLSPSGGSVYNVSEPIQIDYWDFMDDPYFECWGALNPESVIFAGGLAYVEEFSTTTTITMNEPIEFTVLRQREVLRLGEIWLGGIFPNIVVEPDENTLLPPPPLPDGADAPRISAGVISVPPDQGSTNVYTYDGNFFRARPFRVRNAGTADLILYEIKEWVSNDRVEFYVPNFEPGTVIPPGGARLYYLNYRIHDMNYLRANPVKRMTFYIRSNDPEPYTEPVVGSPYGYRVPVRYSFRSFVSEKHIPDTFIPPPPNPEPEEAFQAFMLY